jgi:hypothetical protein
VLALLNVGLYFVVVRPVTAMSSAAEAISKAACEATCYALSESVPQTRPPPATGTASCLSSGRCFSGPWPPPSCCRHLTILESTRREECAV